MSGATFKGSPGPWTTDHTCFDSKIPIRGGVTAYGRPYVIAHVNRPGSAFVDQDKANAALIAAAPDMLGALQKMRGILRSLQPAMNVMAKEVMDDIIREQIDPVIAKALGGDQ